MTPHPRTLRKAREQVKLMVHDGFSTQIIKSYLRRWAQWWVGTTACWSYETLLHAFITACWDATARNHARWLLPALMNQLPTTASDVERNRVLALATP